MTLHERPTRVKELRPGKRAVGGNPALLPAAVGKAELLLRALQAEAEGSVTITLEVRQTTQPCHSQPAWQVWQPASLASGSSCPAPSLTTPSLYGSCPPPIPCIAAAQHPSLAWPAMALHASLFMSHALC